MKLVRWYMCLIIAVMNAPVLPFNLMSSHWSSSTSAAVHTIRPPRLAPCLRPCNLACRMRRTAGDGSKTGQGETNMRLREDELFNQVAFDLKKGLERHFQQRGLGVYEIWSITSEAKTAIDNFKLKLRQDEKANDRGRPVEHEREQIYLEVYEALKREFESEQEFVEMIDKTEELAQCTTTAAGGVAWNRNMSQTVEPVITEKEVSIARVSTAYFGLPGYDWFASLLSPNTTILLLLGTGEGIREVADVVRMFQNSIERGIPTLGMRIAAEKFLEEISEDHCSLRIKFAQVRETSHKDNHAKIIALDDDLRCHVMHRSNVEEAKQLDFLIGQFDLFWKDGIDLNPELADVVEASSLMQPPVDSYLVLLRMLQEMNSAGIPEITCTNYKLGSFQEAIAHATLQVMMPGQNVLLVMPVGSGKTVVGSYIAAALLQLGHSMRTLVSAPNTNICNQWMEVLWDFNVAAKQMNHRDFGLSEKVRKSIETIRPTDFLIVDESHHFRNSGGKAKRFTGMGMYLKAEKSLALFLTATPMSKSYQDADNQVSLLYRGDTYQKINSPKSLLDNHAVIVVTLSFILKYYGTSINGSKGKALEYAEGDFRFYPQMSVNTVRYKDTDAGWLYERISELPIQTRRNGKEYGGTLPKIALKRMVESSPAQIKQGLLNLLHRLEEQVKTGSYVYCADNTPVQYSNPKFLTLEVKKLLEDLEEKITYADDKWQAFCNEWRIANISTRLNRREVRVLIFTSFTNSTVYVRDRLAKEYPDLRYQVLTGGTPDKQKEKAMKDFRNGSQCQVLIATDTLSEGVNMQSNDLDTYVINWDLYWTPYVLHQRIGRVDRPTSQERSVFAWNMYPGQNTFRTMDEDKTLLAMSEFEQHLAMGDTLIDRSKSFAILLGVYGLAPDVDDWQRDLNSPSTKGMTSSEMLYEQGSSYDYRAEEESFLQTTPWISTLLSASPKDQEKARKLPMGSIAVLRQPKNNPDIIGVFALLRTTRAGDDPPPTGRPDPLRDEDLKLEVFEYNLKRKKSRWTKELDARKLSTLQLITNYSDSERFAAQLEVVDDTIYHAIESVVKLHVERQKIEEDEVELVCALVFVSEKEQE